MLYAFVTSILGFAFVFRLFDVLVERKLFSRAELTKIGTALVVATIAAFSVLPKNRCMLLVSLTVPSALAAMALSALISRRSKDFQRGLLASLNITLLKMKSGRSFRQSFAESIAESDARVRSKLSELASIVAFSQQNTQLLNDSFVAHSVEELKKIDLDSHGAIKRLTAFRDRLRMEADFRHRSGQVMSRIRAQSIIMSGLYLAVFTFVAWRFGMRVNAGIMTISVLLFFSGSFWLWFGGRGLRWKV